MEIELNICFECGNNENIHMHHVVPQVLGGARTLPLCDKCHGKVHGIKTLHWQKLAQEGRKKYSENGGVFGRPHGSSESIEVFFNKPKTLEVRKCLLNGMSVRKTSEHTECSTKTVMKVKNILKIKRKKV